MIKYFENIHYGETAVIIGNGPSLRDVPREFLFKYWTFGQNKCYLQQPPLVDFTPTYYVTTDSENDIDHSAVERMSCTKFTLKGKGFRNTEEFEITKSHLFSFNPLCVYEGYSVTFVSLQFAYFMGFTTVLLVGVDHRYRMYDPAKEDDPNHYTPEYRGKTDTFSNPRVIEKGQIGIAEAMELARVAFEADGRRVVNLTPNSRLDVFEKEDLSEWL